MAVGISAATTPTPLHHFISPRLFSKPKAALLFTPSILSNSEIFWRSRRKACFTLCVVLGDHKKGTASVHSQVVSNRVAERLARKRSERFTYLVAAVMSSFGITSMAFMAVYYRFHWQMEGGEVPFSEMFGTFGLSVGAALEFLLRESRKMQLLTGASLNLKNRANVRGGILMTAKYRYPDPASVVSFRNLGGISDRRNVDSCLLIPSSLKPLFNEFLYFYDNQEF